MLTRQELKARKDEWHLPINLEGPVDLQVAFSEPLSRQEGEGEGEQEELLLLLEEIALGCLVHLREQEVVQQVLW